MDSVPVADVRAFLAQHERAAEFTPETKLRIRALARALTPPGEPLAFDEPAGCLTWLWARLATREWRSLADVLGERPPCRFHEHVTDGRPDLATVEPARASTRA